METQETIDYLDALNGRVTPAYNFRTQYNYTPSPGEATTLPSKTIPDQSLSIREILLRFAQGRPLSINNDLVYTGDNFAPDVRKMDLTEIQLLREQNLDRMKQLQEKLADEQAQAYQLDKQKRDKLEALLNQLGEPEAVKTGGGATPGTQPAE